MKRSPMDMDRIITDWKQNAERHDARNFKFLRSLKMKDDRAVDRAARRLHKEAFSIIDCLRCGNCCKTLDIKITSTDAEPIAKHLNMTPGAFAEAYLVADEDGDGKFRQQPCPLLGEDDHCRIYSVRPTDCREYPFTNKEGFVFRTMGHANRALKCPAVFWIGADPVHSR